MSFLSVCRRVLSAPAPYICNCKQAPFTRHRVAGTNAHNNEERETMSSIESLSRSEHKAFLDSFDVVLSDCDGVLWLETEVILGSPEAVSRLKKIGKRFLFITNNNDKTRKELAEKCNKLSYEATEEVILSAAYLVAAYLEEHNFKKKVYVFSNDGTSRELDAVGIRHCGIGPDLIHGDDIDVVANFVRDPEVGAVAVGLDQHLSFPKFVKAASYASDPKVHFLGTNPDLEKPRFGDATNPGDGCFIRAIELAAGRQAVIVSKPDPFVGHIIKKKFGVDPSRTLMIGDNLNTDILLGKRCGFKTLLVLSGVTSLERLQTAQRAYPLDPQTLPDFYADRLANIFKPMESSSASL